MWPRSDGFERFCCGTKIKPTKGAALSFIYADSWIKAQKPNISLSLPVQAGHFEKEAQTFFGNLLP